MKNKTKKTMTCLLLVSLFLISCDHSKENDTKIKEVNQENIIRISEKNDEINIYKEDYLQACKIISQDYIYLEDKLGITREEFIINCEAYADKLVWSEDKEVFINEIKNLMAMFDDGHINWKLDRSMYIRDRGMSLGLILTKNMDDDIIVGKVFEHLNEDVAVGDKIISIYGIPAYEAIEAFSRLNPQSTHNGSLEKAARMYGVDYPIQPLRPKLNDVIMVVEDSSGQQKELVLEWVESPMTGNVDEANDYNYMLLTKSLNPSLEEIPSDQDSVHPSLIFYYMHINSKNVAVLHPRDFYSWSQNDLDETLQVIMDKSPDLLVVDLKDTAGGNFDQVLYLSHALNIDEDFEFVLDAIEKETHKRIKREKNFNYISDSIDLKNVWKGDVMLRINAICASGSDYFPRWFQLNKRGLLIGQATAGAGGGTDDYVLNHTKTVISIPLRDRKISIDNQSIEGHSVMPDIEDDRTLREMLSDIITVDRKSKFIFDYRDIDSDKRVEASLLNMYDNILDDFDMTFEDNIKIIIYKNQAEFWSDTFGGDNNLTTTGFANHVERTIHITSPTDTSIKSEDKMLKVPVHELVHILLPHNYIEIREGIAVYLSDQLGPYTLEDIPKNLSSTISYEGSVEDIGMQYNFAGYKTKFILEECLDRDYGLYKSFMDNPDDYMILGYPSEIEFLKDFKRYLEENAG